MAMNAKTAMATSAELLTGRLKDVSRSFYLTLRILPKPVRRPIGLAYLLARTTDTIADTEILPVEKRLNALKLLRQRILGESTAALEFHELAVRQKNPAEHQLLEDVESMLELLARESTADQGHIRKVLDTITRGQCFDLEYFQSNRPENLTALQTDAELDEYTYAVAGCVGEFWSRICLNHLLHRHIPDPEPWINRGIRFGRGLQLVNVLRDVAEDLQRGRCYLPAKRLKELNLAPEDLRHPDRFPQLQPLYREYLARARNHLAAGWEYTLALPYRQFRLRLACAWPILIGQATLDSLHAANPLHPDRRIKISRSAIYQILIRSTIASSFPAWWQSLLK